MKKVSSKTKIVLSGNQEDKSTVEKKYTIEANKKKQDYLLDEATLLAAKKINEKILGPLFDIIDTAVCAINEQGYFADVNAAYCNIYGYTKEELIGHNAFMVEVVKPSLLTQNKSCAFIKTAETTPAGKIGQHKDGSLLYITASTALLEHTDGKKYKIISIKNVTQASMEATGLSATENKYHLIIEHSLTAFFLITPKGQILEANETATHMFGYSLPEFKKIGRQAIFDTTDPRYHRLLKKSEKEGNVKDFLTGIRKNGEHFCCEVSSVLFADINGETGSRISITDISETLKLHQENLLLLNNTEENFVLVDKDLKIISFNKQFCQSYKQAFLKDVIVGNSILDYCLPEQIEERKGIYKKVFAGEKTFNETEITLLNGNVLITENRYRPIKDDDGNIIAAFVTTFDITEKKRAERELVSTNNRYQALVENGHDVITILSITAKPLYISASINTVLGYTEKNAFKPSFFSLVHPEDKAVLKTLWQKILSQPDIPIRNYVCRLLHKNGSWRWVENTITNMLHDASIEGIVNNFRDVSERVEAAERIKQSEENLKAIFENTDEGFVLFDTNGIVKTCNAYGRQNNFLTTEIKTGTHISEFLEEPRKEISNTFFQKALNGKSTHYERLAKNKLTNQPMWLSFTINPVKEGEKVIAVCITGRDISIRKEKDLKIAQTENLLKRAESITHLGSVEVDYVNNKHIWSDGLYNLLDLTLGDIEPSKENFIQFLHPEDKEYYLNAFAKKLAAKETFIQIECRLLSVKSIEKYVKVYAQPEYAKNNVLIKLVLVIQNITDQKEAEIKIAQTQILLKSAENIAQIGSAEINFDTNKCIWSDEFYRIIGLEPVSVSPTTEEIMQFLHPEEKGPYLKWLQNGLANKIEFQQIETRIIRADGEERNIMVYGSAKYNANGKPGVLIAVIQDITYRKKTELELAASKEIYQSLFYQNPSAVFSLNKEGNITSANHILALKAECSNEELLNSHYSVFVYPDNLAIINQYFEDAKHGITREFETRIITAKGNLLYVLIISMPIIVNNKIIGIFCIANDFTKEKNANTLLNKTFADRQRILDFSLDMICEFDRDGKFLQVSKACEEILGYQSEELIGKPFIDFVIEADKPATLKMVENLSSGGVSTSNFENRIVKKDNGIVNLLWSARWVENDKTMYCIAKNATEIKANEQALGLSEQRYRYLFNNNPQPLFIFDFATGNIIEANHATLNKYGYTKKEFLSLTLNDLRPTSEISTINKTQILESSYGHVNKKLWPHKKKNGELMYMNITSNLIDYNGKSCVLTLLDDVTEKLKAEESSRDSEGKRTLIMNAALDAIICMDINGLITFWNPQAEKIFGWKVGEVLGGILSDLIIPERYRKMHEQGMQKYLKSAEGPALNTVLNLSAINKEQKEFPIQLTIQAIKQGGEEFFCSFIRDVTAQRKAESLKTFEKRDKEALINSTDDLIWSVSKDLELIAGNRAFIKSYKATTGKLIKQGDYLLIKSFFSDHLLLFWHEMYYRALSGETFKKELVITNPSSGRQEWEEVSFNPIYDDNEITGIACYSRNITENKLHQNKLIDINKKLETAQHMARLGYWEVDIHLKTVFWSDELFNIYTFEKTTSSISIQQIINAVHPDDKKNAVQYYKLVMKGKAPYNFEHRIILKDGSIKILLQKGTVIYNENGQPVTLEGTSQDITFQKLAEKAVKDSEEKYRMIFNSNPLPNWIYDLNTLQILEVNDAATKLYGYKSNEFLNMTITEIFIAEEVPFIIQMNKKINNYGILNFGQWQHIKKSGVIINVDITGHSINYNHKNAVMIVSNDITEIIQAQQALVKSIERFEYATKATSDAIWDCDLVNNTIFWGEGFNTLFGYKLKERNPGISSMQAYIHPDDKERIYKSINEVIDNPAKIYWKADYRFKKFDGSYASVVDCALVIRDDKGIPFRIIGAIQDITERIQNEIVLKELNEQLNNRAGELASSNAELEQFAYIASHDLQEPLRMVTGFLSQIQKKYESQLDEAGRSYIHFAVNGAVRMRKIIQDLLEYSRVGWQKYPYEKIDTNLLLKEVVGVYSNSINEKKIKISWKNLPKITAGKIPIQQLFQNLIANAIKYQQPGVNPEIIVSGTENKDHWNFAIADNGIGIDSNFFDKIFVIFQRLHNKDEYSGTGIGLAICKKIIDNHKGKIWVESTPEKGSTFYFTIPKMPLLL